MKKDFIKRVTDSLDMFSEPVISSNIDGNSKISSKTGVFFTLIAIAIQLSYAILHLQTMISFN